MKPPAVVIVGDLHAGSSVGLMPPTFKTDDGNLIAANPDQVWLWGRWLDFWERVDRAYQIEVVIVNGDAPQGVNLRDVQTLTMNESDQIRFALEALEPLRKLRDARKFPVYATRGTAFHSGAGGAREETIWREFGASTNKLGRYSSWLLKLPWRGKRIFATHHVSVGNRQPFTSFNNTMSDWAREAGWHGSDIPDADIRSHVHRTYSLEQHGRWMATAPAWQLSTEFAHKVAPGSTPSIGGLVLWLDDLNELQLRKITYRQVSAWATAIPSLTRSSTHSKSKKAARTRKAGRSTSLRKR